METHIFSSADTQVSYFKNFVQCLVDKFQPLKLICFAKTIISAETPSCSKDQNPTHDCNYCLLMVTESATRVDHQVQDFSNFHYKDGTVCILCHSEESIVEAIKANNRFFLTVYSTGQVLYSRDGMTNFEFPEKFIPTQSAKKAKKHFDHRMPIAEGFLHGAAECLAQKDFNVSTFMMHQVVEQCCILLLRVHLGYRSEVHNLLRMLRLCTSFSERPLKTFLSGSPEDERTFNFLVKSYSGSRYGNGFSVPENDAQILYNRITSFIVLVKELCASKIEEMEQEALEYKEQRMA